MTTVEEYLKTLEGHFYSPSAMAEIQGLRDQVELGKRARKIKQLEADNQNLANILKNAESYAHKLEQEVHFLREIADK